MYCPDLRRPAAEFVAINRRIVGNAEAIQVRSPSDFGHHRLARNNRLLQASLSRMEIG